MIEKSFNLDSMRARVWLAEIETIRAELALMVITNEHDQLRCSNLTFNNGDFEFKLERMMELVKSLGNWQNVYL
jgi:hypothetical protein